MRLLLMGPPGAGKGTQAAIVSAELGVPHVSTGDIFRANVSEGTPLGVEAKRYMDAGDYVPDSVTNAMVRDRLAEPDAAKGFVLDGYPRTLAQVGELDDMLTGASSGLDRVIELTVDREEVVARLRARAVEQGRTDDTEDVIRRRQELYAEETAPLVEVYAQRGLLAQVDGLGTVEAVTARILQALDD
jgi:adenylate kinase